jgi:hypothetical protein
MQAATQPAAAAVKEGGDGGVGRPVAEVEVL